MQAAQRITVLLMCSLLWLCVSVMHVTPAAAQTEPGLTKWKLEGTVPGSSGGLGVYRRVGSRWDLGLAVSSSVSVLDDDYESRGDSPTEFHSTTRSRDHNFFQIGLAPELRRWTRRTDRLRTFFGLRGTLQYSWRDQSSREYDLQDAQLLYDTNRSTESRRAVGTGLLAGAEWQVSQHLGLAAKLNPVNFSFSWSRYGRDSAIEWSDREAMRSRTVEYSNRPELRWQIDPALVASINF